VFKPVTAPCTPRSCPHFLVTLSGAVIAAVGSAFGEVMAGKAALFVQQYGQQRRMPHASARQAQKITTSRSLKKS